MARRMFVVMEVKELPTNKYWVIPLDANGPQEALRKDRAIYADDMKVEDFEAVGAPLNPGLRACKQVTFYGVSPSPEEDEFEKWVKECPIGIAANYPNGFSSAVKDWLRHMPKQK